MLRLRRRRVTVSSTLLWQQLLRDREANAPWQRLRRNLLLFLQLAILAALVIALARPYLPIPNLAGGNSVVLLDASASMQASDGASANEAAPITRFEAVKTEILHQINGLGSGDRMTLIHVGRTPVVLAATTNDRELLRQALETAQPEAGAADWDAAFALAAGAAQGYQEAQVIVASDGGLPSGLPALPGEMHFLPVGRAADNLAISALASRSDESGPLLLAQATNHGDVAAQALLSLTIDGTLFDSRRVSLPAAESISLTWDLPSDAEEIQAQLLPDDPAQDLLMLDNRAYAVNQNNNTTRALLVTEGNVFLEKLFAILPGVEAFKVSPEEAAVEEIGNEYDLVVFDSVALPATPPTADLLIINPQPAADAETAASWLPVTNTFTDTVAIRLSDSSLLQFVDWRNINIQEAQQVDAPWAEVLVEAAGGPLLLTGELDGRRAAILTFDLRQSDLPLQIAFPVIMANIVNWLNPGQVFNNDGSLAPGEPVALAPGVNATAVSVVKPDGTTWETPLAADTEQVLFSETGSTGIYQVIIEDASGIRQAGRFAVNLFEPAESQIRPTRSIRVGAETVGDGGASQAAQTAGQEELWLWFALAAFLILLIEWWIYHRGIRRPNFKLR
jgi:hypothetical protein